MRILITGIGGSGKTTIIDELSSKGEIGIDLDRTDLCYWINKQTGEKAVYVEGSGSTWLDNHGWKLDIEGLKNFLGTFPEERNVYIGGKIATSQYNEVMSFFDKAFLLQPSDDVLVYRQSTRTNKTNKFAKSKEEQDHLLKNRKRFEEHCLKNGAVSIDADKSIDEVINKINDIVHRMEIKSMNENPKSNLERARGFKIAYKILYDTFIKSLNACSRASEMGESNYLLAPLKMLFFRAVELYLRTFLLLNNIRWDESRKIMNTKNNGGDSHDLSKLWLECSKYNDFINDPQMGDFINYATGSTKNYSGAPYSESNSGGSEYDIYIMEELEDCILGKINSNTLSK